MSTSALRVAEVTKRFGSTTAVDAVSLDVAPGSIVGLVGANGAGKTTLIRLMLGLLTPDGETVELLGGPPTPRRRARVGYVPQGLGLWTDLSTREHLALMRDVYARAVMEPADAELRDVADRPLGELPLGLRRRASCAIALSHQPDLLLLDEPTSGMDPLARHRLWELLRSVAGAGTGLLVSTHHLAEAEMCDDVVLLSDGRVVAAGTPDELAGRTSTVEVVAPAWEQAWTRLDEAGFAVLPAGRALRVTDAAPGQVRACLAAAGIDAEVASAPSTLEEVFLSLAAA